MSLTPEQRRIAIATRDKLIQLGHHPADASAIVRRAIARTSSCCGSCGSGGPCEGLSGMGEGAPPAILSDMAKVGNDPLIAAIRNAVSPWLWVTSLIGFGMGLLNTRRIATMYRKHIAGRRKS